MLCRIVSFILLLALPHAVNADVVFDVNLTQDAPDAVPGDGICSYDTSLLPDEYAVCTLRAAVMEANATSLDDDDLIEVRLVPGTRYDLTLESQAEQESLSGDLDLLRPMWIGVAGEAGAVARARIVANTGDRLFHLMTEAAGSILYGLDLSGGAAPANGCAIYSAAAGAELRWLDIHDNCTSTSTTSIILAVDSLTLADSSIHANHGHPVGCCGDILRVSGSGAELTIERSSIFGNAPFAHVYAVTVGDGAHLDMSDSTVSQNGDEQSWGVIVYTQSTADIRNSTIVFHGEDEIRVADSAVIVRNSIVLSRAAGRACTLLSGSLEMNWSLTGDDSCADGGIVGQANEHGVAVSLSELGYWGGLTKGHRPSSGSIAVDRTPASECAPSEFDQRGFTRVVSHTGLYPARCDAGALELEVPPIDHFADGFMDGFDLP